ncbi:MAG TPA: hypothetical protein VFO35_06550 [Steroidobacteraceae bacterium]|nr:hypothetical protein [Steroidobacteraceae bacterium]
MQDLICQAIREKRLLELQHEGQALRVAPHIYGIDAAGEEMLTCYQVWGGTDGEPAGWLSLRLAAISQLKLTSKRFAPRPEHQRSEGAIARVFCQV